MNCMVCAAASANAGICPQCGYNNIGAEARDPQKILAAQQAFREKAIAYSPNTRVTWKDKMMPWAGLALGAVLFLFWLKACSTFGPKFF